MILYSSKKTELWDTERCLPIKVASLRVGDLWLNLKTGEELL
jgi:hypothetical protein